MPNEVKKEVFPHFLKLKNQVENETDCKIQCLLSNGGREYFPTEFTALPEEKGIH